MNEICSSCTYRSCLERKESWKFRPSLFPYESNENAELAIIVPQPTEQDIATGLHLSSEPGEWFRAIVRTLKVPFIVDALLRCQDNQKAKPKEFDTCQPFWKQTVDRVRPKVILALGLEAGRRLTGLKGLTLGKLKGGVWKYVEDDSVKVVVTELPSLHATFTDYSRGGKDLRPEYARVFRLIQSILSGTYRDINVSFELCDNPDRIADFVKAIRSADCKEASNDCETANRNPVLCHPSNELLTTGFGIRRHSNYEQYVFYVREWSKPQIGELYRQVCPGLTIIGTNWKYDYNCAFWFGGVDLRDYIKCFHDTMILNYIRDQSKWNNSLEKQGSLLLGIPGYKNDTNAEFDLIRQLMKPVPKTPAKTYHERMEEAAHNIAMYWPNLEYAPQPKEQLHYGHLSRDFTNSYQAKDLWVQSRVWWEHFREALPNYPTNLKNIYKLMIGATYALANIERNGLPVSVEDMERVKGKNEAEIGRIQAWVDNHPYVKAARLDSFNSKSPKQVDAVVKASRTHVSYTSVKTDLAVMDKGELKRQSGKGPPDGLDGRPVTGRLFQQWFSDKPPKERFWWAISQLRSKRDRLSKFIVPYANLAINGNIHSTFSLTRSESSEVVGDTRDVGGGIESGRVASHTPSLHLIIKDPVIRDCYPAPPGWGLQEADFSGAEPVILGLLTQCKGYLRVFRRKWANPNAWDSDLYQMIATKFWKIPNPAVFWAKDLQGEFLNKEAATLRKMAKIFVLSVTYLQTPHSTATLYGVSEEEAEAFTRWFFDEFPEILVKLRELIYTVTMRRMVVTPSGRMSSFELEGDYHYEIDQHGHLLFHELVHVLGISHHDGHILRKAWNFLIQSTASDCCLAQMVRLDKLIYTKGWKWLRIINAVHDSLWFKYLLKYQEEAARIVRQVMEDPRTYEEYGFNLKFSDPEEEKLLVVDLKQGLRLGKMRGVER